MGGTTHAQKRAVDEASPAEQSCLETVSVRREIFAHGKIRPFQGITVPPHLASITLLLSTLIHKEMPPQNG